MLKPLTSLRSLQLYWSIWREHHVCWWVDTGDNDEERSGSLVALWFTNELPESVIVPIVLGAVRGGG